MRPALTSLALLAVASFSANAQITGTITRQPIARTTLTRLVLLSPANPATGRRGQQSLTVQITGTNTHFAQDMTTLSMGDGITLASPLNVLSPTTATAVINIDPGTPAGSRTITMSTGSEVASLTEGFSVTENPDYFPKSCGGASNGSLGSIFKGSSKQVTGLIDVAGVEDWFVASAPSGTNLKLTLSAAAPGSEFELTAYSMCGGAPVASTTQGVAPKQLSLPGGSTQYVLRVRASQWKAESSRFTLTLVGD